MIYQLMKRDPAWRAIPWVLIDIGITWPIFVMRVSHDMFRTLLGAAASICVLLCMGVALRQQSATDFFAGLPVRARDLFTSRVVALLALIWGPALIGTGLIWIGVWGRASGVQNVALLEIASLATGVGIGTQASLFRGLPFPRWAVMLCLFLPTFLPLAVLPLRLTAMILPAVAACVVSAGAIFLYTWRSLPLSASVVGDPAGVRSKSEALPDDSGLVTRPSPWILTKLYSWSDLIWLPLLFFQAFVGPWISATFFIAFSSLRAPFRAGWIEPLPISRRTLLALTRTPLLIAMVAGYLLSANGIFSRHGAENEIAETTSQGWPPSARQPSCGQINITPPLAYWLAAKDEASADIAAPWGESYRPPVIRVLGKSIYNPFAVGCTNTRRFFEWQFARATAAVYGRPVTLNDFVHNRNPHPRTAVRLQILNIAALLTCALGVIATSLLSSWRRWRFNRRYTWALGFVIFLLYVFVASLLAPRIPELIQRLSWSLPSSLIAMAILAAIPPAVGWYFVDRLVQEGEFCVDNAEIRQSPWRRRQAIA